MINTVKAPVMAKPQLKNEVTQNITDELNRQNTAAVVRAILHLMIDNSFNAATEQISINQVKNLSNLLQQIQQQIQNGIDLTTLPGYGGHKQLGTDAEGNLIWLDRGGYV